MLQTDPELVRSQVILRNEQTGRRETIFATRTKAGQILASYSDFHEPNYNVFCIVDWSPDGNYLLLQEILGHLYSDVSDEFYWIYNRIRRERALIDLKPLRQAIEQKWRKTGVDFREFSYQTVAIGWEGRKSKRVVFEAFSVYHDPAIFLGTWSVVLTGKEPRLLSEKEGGFTIVGFGEIVDAPE